MQRHRNKGNVVDDVDATAIFPCLNFHKQILTQILNEIDDVRANL